MSETATQTKYWPFAVARAIPALAVGVVITFAQDHSASLGLYSFAAFATVTGAIVLASGIRRAVPDSDRTTTIVQGVVSVIAGLVALAFAGEGLPFYLYLVSVWAAITGFIELYQGLRNRGRNASSRDWVFAGALTAAFAVATLIIPTDLQDTWAAENGAEGVLTASVVSVGALGAYAAVLGVYLVIAGLSLKWTAAQPAEAALSEGSKI